MDSIRFPEFRASLESTTYPFVPTASLHNGQVGFLEGTFLDAHLYAVNSSGRCYISQVVVQSDQFTIYVGDATDATRLSAVSPIPLTQGVLQLVDGYGRPSGVLVSEPSRLALLAAWGLGTHVFEQAQTEFCITCQMPIPDTGVSGFRLESGEILSGRIWLIGEDGVMLRTERTTDAAGNNWWLLRVDVVGDPLYLQRLCDDASLFVPVNPIRTIRVCHNGNFLYDCLPDEYGNFNIQMNDALAADAALRIRTISDGVVFQVEGSVPDNKA